MSKRFKFPIPHFLLSAVAGGLLTLSFAPYNYWICSLLSLSLFAWLYLSASGGEQLSGRRSLWLAFCYGLGLFGSGGSWVYVSITEFGNSSALMGIALTGAFVAVMALLLALPFYFLGRFTDHKVSFALAFPALWFVSEWLRSWIFTGFPWLYAGYGHLHTWLSGWAPVLSVYGIGLLLALTAAVIALATAGRLTQPDADNRAAISLIVAALLPWPLGALLAQFDWTQPEGDTVTVGLVQANIPQDKKWLPEFRGETISRYQDGTQALSEQGVDVIVWPEAALPVLYSHAPNLMQALQRNAEQSQIDLITGLLYDRQESGQRVVHNSAVVFGRTPGLYHKRHLVPFGEYVPLEEWLRGTIEFFNLPTSFIRPGEEEQQSLNAGGISWAPLICYEIVYPRMVADSALSAQVLLTISNDAWFGDSLGPLQHMQIAQMRALETGRYLVRGTNTGITAIVDPRGRIVTKLPQFERANMTGEVRAMRGATPFMLAGISLVFALALPMLAAAILLQRQKPVESEAPFAGEASD